MSENENLIEYYKELLIIQYNDKPKAKATIDALVRASMIFDVANKVRDGFNIETAVGKQQDILGKYLGAPRVITGTSFSRDYFGFAEYGASAPFDFYPLLKYGQEAPDAQFRNYTESTQSLLALNDEEYRIIQKLAVVRNNSNASVKDIDDILFQLFGAECYFIDRMNMTVVSYMVGEKWARLFNIAKSTGLLPNPAGVGTGLIVVPDINNIFAFSLYGGDAPSFAVGYFNYFETWEESGAGLHLEGTGKPVVATLSSSRIAFIDGYGDGVPDELRAYDFDGTQWTLAGNPLIIPDSTAGTMTALSPSRVVFIDGMSQDLRTYDFDGTNWSTVGNVLHIACVSPSISALSSSRIAFVEEYYDELRVYDFDGTNWTLAGTPLSIPGTNFSSITALSSTRIALFNFGLGILSAYDFDGTNWTLAGNSLTITVAAESMTTLSSSRVVFIDYNNDGLWVYDFDGTDWTLYGNETIIPNSNNPQITALSSTRIAFADSFYRELRAYDYTRDLSGCMAKYPD